MKLFLKIFFSFFILTTCSFPFSSRDSLGINNPVIVDSLFNSDSLYYNDSTAKKGDVDSVIYSSSRDSLIFFVMNKKMELYGNGNLKYKETELKSGKIYVDFETHNIEAYGIESDTAKGGLIQTPILVDKGEEYFGKRMKYNFKTLKGYITFAETKESEAKYSGAKIKKATRDVYFIENGVYSTCTLEKPHYYFYGSEMKMIQKDQLVGKWIWLTFGGVPFPIPLPFAVFPLEHGRRSGILAPAFGNRPGFGKYFSRFGYFWAINDYMDINFTGDYYTKGGYSLGSRFRYTKRYDFSGNLEGSFSDLHQGERTDPDYAQQKDWRIRWIHNQTLTPTSRFDVNLEFMSGNYFTQNSVDYNQLLRQEIYSNASYFKNWDESGSSLTINYSRKQELKSGNIYEILPTLSFSKSPFYPFKSIGNSTEKKWYQLFGISYNAQMQNQRNKIDNNLTIRAGIQHNVGFSIAPKIGYITLSPSFSYRELWYNKRIQKNYFGKNYSGSDSIITSDLKEINFVRTFSFGLSTSTKIYGMFQPNILGISAIRHILQPSISYTYQPDFSQKKWGYYDSYINSEGKVIKYNKYEREIYGGAPSGESQSINFGLANNFEMKTKVDPTDTSSREQKIQLLNFNASISYNFVADSLKFSPLHLDYRTQIGNILSFSGNSSYSLYDYVDRGVTINKFLLSEGKGFLRLLNFGFSISASLSGENLKSKKHETDSLEENVEQYFPQENRGYKGLYETEQPNFDIPWSVALNYNYNISKTDPTNPIKYSNIMGSLNINLTKNWKISVTGSYDLIDHRFAAPQVMISRDLHCWLMNFTWNPLGSYTGYRLEIKVKAPQLQDLKITKTDRLFSGR